MAAARIHTLPAAVVPVVVGSALAAHDGAFRWEGFVLALIGALAIQVGANFANDVSDAARGADTEDRLGPPRMVATGVISPREMWVATWLAVTAAAACGLGLVLIAGPVVLLIGVASVLAMLGYVGGPAPYGYRGLGEVFVFAFFGVVATAGSRYVHDMSVPLSAWLLSVPVGMLATAILVANNHRDRESDREAGKRTLAVILGAERTRILFTVLVYGAFPLVVGFALAGWTPFPTAFAAFLAPYAIGPVRMLTQSREGATLIRALQATARLHLWTGLVIAGGALL